MNQRQTGFVFADGCFTLAVKSGIDQCELPRRRRLAGHDAELPTVKVQILCLIGHLMQAGKPGANGKIDMAEKGMLGGMKANGRSPGIAGADGKINIADRGVESARVGIGDILAGSGYHTAWGGRQVVGHASAARAFGPRARPCKKEHVGDAVSVSGSTLAQHEDRALRPITDQPHPGPEIDRPADAIASLRNKHDALALALLHLVNGCLDGRAIVSLAVRMSVKFRSGEVNGCWIVRTTGVEGGGQTTGRNRSSDTTKKLELTS